MARQEDGARTIGVGMLGYEFMGKAHANAYRTLPYMVWPPPMVPRLVAVAGRNAERVDEAAERYGFSRGTTDWRELVEDPEIDLFDNAAPNAMHAEPTIAAAAAGKHVLCEKPLGRDAEESFAIWQAVAATGVEHMCAFNYRFVPAVRLAREMLEAGELGEIHHFRGSYQQEWIADPKAPHVWRLDRGEAGSGALGDVGSHVIDLARFLVGEIVTVSGRTSTIVPERPGGSVDVDDAVEAIVDFESGVSGSISVTRFARGRKNSLTFEINGSKGSLAFDLERINELKVNLEGSTPGEQAQGFRTVLVTEPEHPFMGSWWPAGHVLGWEHTFVHEIAHLLAAVAGEGTVAPYGATLEDGYRAAEVCDAIVRSSGSGAREPIRYRALGDQTPDAGAAAVD